jgi:hypothetical protein
MGLLMWLSHRSNEITWGREYRLRRKSPKHRLLYTSTENKAELEPARDFKGVENGVRKKRKRQNGKMWYLRDQMNKKVC